MCDLTIYSQTIHIDQMHFEQGKIFMSVWHFIYNAATIAITTITVIQMRCNPGSCSLQHRHYD